MESLSESYVSSLLRRNLDTSFFTVSAQDRCHHLFEEPNAVFQMKPDIVITNKDQNTVFIMDTKWKLLSEDKANNGISQASMYQMYAYQKKYNAQNVTLLCPKTEQIKTDKIGFREIYDDGESCVCTL